MLQIQSLLIQICCYLDSSKTHTTRPNCTSNRYKQNYLLYPVSSTQHTVYYITCPCKARKIDHNHYKTVFAYIAYWEQSNRRNTIFLLRQNSMKGGWLEPLVHVSSSSTEGSLTKMFGCKLLTFKHPAINST